MERRLAAVRSVGWSGVGLVVADLARAREGIGLHRLRRMLDDAGIRQVELEFLGGSRNPHEPIRMQRGLCFFEAADVLGAKTIKVSGQYATPFVDRSRFADALAGLAEDAAQHGVRVAVEPMPMNNLRTLESGMDLIREVDHPAAGLCVDTQHVRRGGTDYRAMSSFLDLHKVFVVELDDSLVRLVGPTPLQDATDHRLYPGEGELDAIEFIAEILQLGWTGPWGVEILSESHRALPVEVAVRRAFDATVETIDAAERLLIARRAR